MARRHRKCKFGFKKGTKVCRKTKRPRRRRKAALAGHRRRRHRR